MQLGVAPRTARYRALFAALASLKDCRDLPGVGDFEAVFHPGRVHVRRVDGFNVWILYRFDATFLDALTVRDQPPTPTDDR